MELLYLLLSVITSSTASFALSTILLLRTLLTRLFSLNSTRRHVDSVALYEGIVWHERRHPVRHAFRYSVRYALFDLDSSSRTPPDHLSADEARRVAGTNGPVYLLTIPPSVGYEQNPLSLYYCYEVDSTTRRLTKCIAEITNTPWGERVTFVFNPTSDLVAKPLHVSPFMDMLGNWKIKANAPEDSLSVTISIQHPEFGDYFLATLKAKRVPSILESDYDLFFWLMPHKVALWIYWHALKLWWKNVQFIVHPRYHNTKYREEASMRDQKLQLCEKSLRDENKRLQDHGICPVSFVGGSHLQRQFKWRDAKWPWG